MLGAAARSARPRAWANRRPGSGRLAGDGEAAAQVRAQGGARDGAGAGMVDHQPPQPLQHRPHILFRQHLPRAFRDGHVLAR